MSTVAWTSLCSGIFMVTARRVVEANSPVIMSVSWLQHHHASWHQGDGVLIIQVHTDEDISAIAS